MNVAQLIGELMLRADGVPLPVRVDSAPPARVRRTRSAARPDRRGQVLELVADGREIDNRGQAAALGIKPGNASVLLFGMRNEGLLVRNGKHGAYRYSAA